MTARVGQGHATWSRGLGVTLRPVDLDTVRADGGLLRALTDGVKRSLDEPPPLPGREAGIEWYAIREARRTVGVAAVRRECPRPGEAALLAVAVAPQHRGRNTGAKAVLLAERRLRAEGYTRLLARVPRTNGRGLYFMLRCGFTPVAERPDDPGDATWFARRAAG